MLDYQERFYKFQFFPTLIKEGCNHILHGGDIFDRRKYINFNTLNRTKKMFLDPARDLGISIDIIPGNHDVSMKNTNDINSLRELLYGYPNVNIIEKPTVLKFYKQVLLPREDRGFGISHDSVLERSIMMLPWMNAENFKSSMEFVNANHADVLYGHLELAGFEMYAGVPNNHGLEASLFKKFGKVWSGHFHHQSRADNIHYLGAPMEFTFADCGDRRGFHLYDTETDTLTFKQNPDTLFEKVYYNDESPDSVDWDVANLDYLSNKIVKLFVTAKKSPASFERFVERLYRVDTIDLTINENYSEFNEANIDIDVSDCSTKDLMDKYVEGAETSMNKDRLKEILGNLYVEALYSDKA